MEIDRDDGVCCQLSFDTHCLPSTSIDTWLHLASLRSALFCV